MTAKKYRATKMTRQLSQEHFLCFNIIFESSTNFWNFIFSHFSYFSCFNLDLLAWYSASVDATIELLLATIFFAGRSGLCESSWKRDFLSLSLLTPFFSGNSCFSVENCSRHHTSFALEIDGFLDRVSSPFSVSRVFLSSFGFLHLQMQVHHAN